MRKTISKGERRGSRGAERLRKEEGKEEEGK